MKITDLSFFIRESWLGFLRSGIMSIVSVATVTISLIVFGMFMLILFNVNNLVDGLSSKLEIVLYLKNISTTNQIQTLQTNINKLSGVKSVEFISKQTAWEKFQQSFQGKASLEGILQHNPLPDSLIVKVNNIQILSTIAKQLSAYTEIDDIRYGGELANRINKFTKAIKIAGWGTISLLGLATLLIVVNTIRLTVLARQDEITIMKLVGATDHFIKWPFIIEGIIIGTIGATISMLILRIGYNFITPHLKESLPFLPFIYSPEKLNLIYLKVVIGGIFLGLFGGYISVSRSLKVNI